MANLQKHRAHESLNTDTAASWDVNSILTAAVSGGSAASLDVSSYNTLGLFSNALFQVGILLSVSFSYRISPER